jgi:putative membrane protein insertion efficiency factor
MTAIGVFLVRGYRTLLSPLLAPRCKYHPTCSQYALDAYRELGFVRGTIVAAWRLLRCNPWSDGGVDYVCDRRLFRTAP